MARRIRLEYPGAVYHVMCRGDRRENIFLDDKDRWRFLDTLGEACARSGMRVHSYVLMPNHYHLLLETPEGNLVAGMRWFQSTYTSRFNVRHRLCGHLFQGRYKAAPIDADAPAHFRTVSDYIHLNPARAGLLDKADPRLGGYRWSSYRAFVGGKPLPVWLVRARVFQSLELPDESPSSRRRYAAHLARRVADALGRAESAEDRLAWTRIRRGWLVGDETFRTRMLRLAGAAIRGRARTSFAGDELAVRHDEATAERLLASLSGRWNCADWSATPKSDPRKQVAAWVLRSRTTVGGPWIAARLCMGHPSTVSRSYRNVQDTAAKTPLDDLKQDAIHGFTD